MSDAAKLVFIYVKLPIAVNVEIPLGGRLAMETNNIKLAEADLHSFFDQCKDHSATIGAGAILADEAACYPAILKLIQWCQKGQHPFAIVPLGKRSLTLSPDYQGLTKWLADKGQAHRLTGFVLPGEEKKL